MDLQTLFTFDRNDLSKKLNILYQKDFSSSCQVVNSRLRIFLLLPSQPVSIEAAGWTSMVVTPTILCLNSQEAFRVSNPDVCRGATVLFHPAAINRSYKLDILLECFSSFEKNGIDGRDFMLFDPFRRPPKEPHIFHCPLNPSALARIQSILSGIAQEAEDQSDGFWICRMRAFLFELLFFIQRLYLDRKNIMLANEVSSHPQVPMEGEILQYLHAHYQEPLGLSAMARVFATNRTSFSQQLREKTGKTLTAYLKELRIQAACTMLVKTRMPMTEIAEKIGYADHSRFSRIFKQHIGYTPRQYRQMFTD